MRAAILAALALLVSCREATPAKPPESQKPDLFLMTALPLAWGEGFSLDQPGSPAMAALGQAYRVKLIDLPSQLPERGLLLAAQPRALPAEELVRLDAWVRRGGRMVLLADPLLEWPGEGPLGDRMRPPAAFADTGLLQHWGLRLEAPDQRGPRASTIGGAAVLTASPGLLSRVGGRCEIADSGLVARCSLGKGRAVVVADADWLNVGSGRGDEGNLPALVSQLAALSH